MSNPFSPEEIKQLLPKIIDPSRLLSVLIYETGWIDEIDEILDGRSAKAISGCWRATEAQAERLSELLGIPPEWFCGAPLNDSPD